MAMQLRFGPVKGAGTAVIEKAPSDNIQASDLGSVAYIGQFERGVISTVAAPAHNLCTSAAELARRMGGRLGAFLAPDCAQDYWSHSGGAGKLVAVRVTDGNELTPECVLYSRHWGTDFYASLADKDSQSQIKVPVLKLKAQNAGSWGGQGRIVTGDAVDITPFTATTLATTLTMKQNEYAGATLKLEGAGSYKVVSNTTAGVLTVATGVNLLTDLTGASNFKWSLILDNTVLDNGNRRGLSVQVVAAELDSSVNFGLEVRLDGQFVKRWPTLNMDPASKYYAPTIINDDTGNLEITAVDMLAVGQLIDADMRPANLYGRATTCTATDVTFEPAQVVSVGHANIKLGAIILPAVVTLAPHRLTFTWVNASNKYTVAATAIDNPKVLLRNLADFAVGAGAQKGKRYSPTYSQTVGVELDHNSAAPADGSTFIIDVLPVNSQVAPGGYVFPDIKAQPSKKFRVKSATSTALTVESGDPSAVGAGSTAAAVTGTVAGPHAVIATNKFLKLSIDGRVDLDVTLTEGGARTTTQVVADINSAAVAAFGASSVLAAIASVSAADKVTLTSPGGVSKGGKSSTVEIKVVANDAYTLLGLTVAVTKGTNGKEAEFQYGQEPGGGFDGGTPTDQAFLDALSISASPLNQLEGKGMGVMQVAAPGVTSTAVQKQGITFCETKNHAFTVQVPSATTDESTAVDYINATIGRSDFALTYFPSWGYVNDPDKPGLLKLLPVLGMVHGRDAGFARTFGGYHRPAAGTDCTLPRIVKLPTGDKVLDQEVLNPQGLNALVKKKGNLVVWGARMIAKSTSFQFKNHRLQLSHYEHTFLVNFDGIIFSLNNAELRAQLISEFKVFFSGEYSKGAVQGAGLDDAVSIKIDGENNTQATMAAGDLNAEIMLRLANIVERFVITVGKQGIFEKTT